MASETCGWWERHQPREEPSHPYFSLSHLRVQGSRCQGPSLRPWPAQSLCSWARLPTTRSTCTHCGSTHPHTVPQMAAVAAWRGSPPPPSKGEVGTEPPGDGWTRVHTWHTHMHTIGQLLTKSRDLPLSHLSLTSGLDPGKLSNQEKDGFLMQSGFSVNLLSASTGQMQPQCKEHHSVRSLCWAPCLPFLVSSLQPFL